MKRKLKKKRFGACYFCLERDNIRSDPRNLIGTVAYQLCKYIEQYRTKVGGESSVTTILANSVLGFNELFTKLLQEPLGKCNTCSERMLVIIDALDETNYKSREDFFYVLRDRFPLLPKWLVFFITSRPEDTVRFNLKSYKPCIKICAGNGKDRDDYRHHEADIRRFLENKVNFSELPYSVEDVVEKCDGMFLYAYYISQVLSDRTSFVSGAHLEDLFPGNIERYFFNNFKRIFEKLGDSGLYWKLFGCVIAAPAPLPLPFISFILEKENSNLDKQPVIDAVSQFVVVRTTDDTILFSHNLIPPWLTNEKKASLKLFIDRDKASEYFKEIILTCALSDQPEGGLSINSAVLNYLLRVSVRFLCSNYDNRDTMEIVFGCLTNFHFLQKRVNTDRLEIFSVVSDYKLCSQCQSLNDAEKEILQEICTALEKDILVLVERRHLLPSCLRWTSEDTQRKLAVSGDTLMMCKRLDWTPYVSPTMSVNDSYFALSPDRKLLAEGNTNTRIVRIYDACSLKEVLGPDDCVTRMRYLIFSRDGKFLFFGMESAGLSVERGRVEEIPLSWRKKRIVDQCEHWPSCVTYAFLLWAKLELSLNKDCHSEEICLRKVQCLLTVAKCCSRLYRFLDYSSRELYDLCDSLESKDLNDCQQEFDALLSHMPNIEFCKDCLKYYKQEPSLTTHIQRIAEMYQWGYFLWERASRYDGSPELLRCVLSLMKASRELPSPVPKGLFQFDGIVQSPNGKLIAVKGSFIPKQIGEKHRADTLAVFKYVPEMDESELFTDPVYVVEQVTKFAFTSSSDFVVFVQEEVPCFQALSLQTGAILSCVSGFSPVFHIPSQQVGFVFCAGREKSIFPLGDFLGLSLKEYLVLPTVTSTRSPSGITFTSGGNISYLSSNFVLFVLIRNGDGSFATKCTPLKCPDGCVVEKCALSRKGNSIAISQNASIFLFCDGGFRCTVFKGSEDIGCQVSSLIFSHDSTLLLYCVERGISEAEVCLWNVLQEKPSVCFFASTLVSIDCCCFSRDSSMVILCGELRVEIWEDVLCSHQCLKMVIEMNEMWPYQTNDRFHCCSVSSGNELLACCIADDVLMCSLCSPAKESFCRLPSAHLGQIHFCQFLKEARYLISYGIDGVVFLLDLYEGKAVAFARVVERQEIIKGMSVSSMEDEVVCVISSGRVITIKLHGLKSATVPPPQLRDVTQSSSAFGAGGGYLSQEPEVNKLLEDMDVIACDESEDDSDVEEIQV